MKNINLTKSAFALASFIFFVQPSITFAIERDGKMTQTERREMQRTSQPEIVKWVGTVRDDANTHTTEHGHELKFTRKDTGDSYNIVDSPELVKLHHETEKNFVLEIEAEKTPRFIFWGGNLIVKKFQVIEEASGPIAHTEPVSRRPSNDTRIRGRHSL